jgi:hypothetical protein
MTSGEDNTAENSARAVLELLATIYGRTKEIFWILNKNPAVAKVTHDCDVGRFNDFMTGQVECHFEILVDATTRADRSFCWRVSVVLTSTGWRLDRAISTPIGESDVNERFEEITFKRCDELVANYSTLMNEFVESARSVDFDDPYKSASGEKSS